MLSETHMNRVILFSEVSSFVGGRLRWTQMVRPLYPGHLMIFTLERLVPVIAVDMGDVRKAPDVCATTVMKVSNELGH